MGEEGGALVLGGGEHELGVALDLPHVDPEAGPGVEADRTALLEDQPTAADRSRSGRARRGGGST